MKERRRYPRINFECIRILLPGREPLEVSNISLQGCFVPMEDPPPQGTVLHFQLHLPGIGPIPVRGIVLHHGGPEPRGAGIYFLEIEGEFHHVFAKFLKTISKLEEVRKLYEKLLSSDE